MGTSLWPHTNHHKIAKPVSLLPLLFQASSHLLGSCHALLESFIVWVKSFHTLLGAVWCHRSQHPNRILCGLHPVSWVSRPFSPSPYLLVYWRAICRASSVSLALWPMGLVRQEIRGEKRTRSGCSSPLPPWCHPSGCCGNRLWQRLPPGMPSSHASTPFPTPVPSALGVVVVYQGCISDTSASLISSFIPASTL